LCWHTIGTPVFHVTIKRVFQTWKYQSLGLAKYPMFKINIRLRRTLFLGITQPGTASILIFTLISLCITSTPAKAIRHSSSYAKAKIAGQNHQPVGQLESGKAIERELAGGGSHAYQLNLEVNQYLNLVVTQKGIDVVVTMTAPDGGLLLEVDSPNGAEGPEPVALVASVSGVHRLVVHSLDKQAASGRYGIVITELRLATPEDRKRLVAERTYAEAEALLNEGKAEAVAKAIERFQQALLLWREMNNRPKEANTLSDLSYSYGLLSNSQKALEYDQQALVVRRAIGDKTGEADSLQSIGSDYAFLGEMRLGIQFYNQALTIYKALGDRAAEARIFMNLGAVFGGLGETQESLNQLNRALPIFRDMGVRPLQAHTLIELGYTYANLGDFQKALELLNQAKTISREIKDNVKEARAIGTIGTVYAQLKEYPKALDSYQQELQMDRSAGDRYAEANLLIAIGSLHQEMADNQKALEYFHQALALNRAISNRRGEASGLSFTGDTYSRLGEHQKGLELLNQALALYQAIANQEGETLTLFRIAQVNRRMTNLEEARAKMEMVINKIESSRKKKSTSQDLRISFFALVQKYYEEYIDLLMQMHTTSPGAGYDRAALAINEKTLARGLLEILDESRADIRQGVDPKLLDHERSLNERITAKLDNLTKLLGLKHTQAQKTAAEKELAGLTDEYRQAQADIRKQSPRYAALVEPQPANAQEIQKNLLDPDTMLLEYGLGEERSYLWAVTANSVNSYQLPPRREIETAVRRLYDLLSSRQLGSSAIEQRARAAENEARYRIEAAALSRLLLGPVATQLGTKRLLIVAPGALQYLPFGALTDPAASPDMRAGGGKSTDALANRLPASDYQPLIINHEIVSLASASVLAVLRRDGEGRKPNPKAVAVLADPVFGSDDPRISDAGRGGAVKQGSRQPSRNLPPASPLKSSDSGQALRGAMQGDPSSLPRLPFSRQEAEAIFAVLADATSLKALDFRASRATATSSELSQYRIVHFATHGLLNSERPEWSGLVLSQVDEAGRRQDGFLRLHEIYNLKLPAELVVLSACQTALGKDIRGEGLVGLTRGFMYAGAQRVVASLWQVDDLATAELMGKFYKGMLQGRLRPAAALRAAQIEMFKTKRRQAPYFWAAFVLQGEWK
jgi:CHAT domain-containing protein